MSNNPLIDPDEHPVDNISSIATILRFLEETAGNYGTRQATPARADESGYSVEGWAGMNAILGLARQGLAGVADSLGGKTRPKS
ncbi:hypothetical protein [uncultured Desulfovibrio sp.]|uniref:hypothetical protein n=1 Tax=uncultured Desulfovibrio sp. TaxID=167968 RepID=UPI002614EFC7|nr:hypothetical protein [uncultured Desulfovibrio sp.]